MSRILSAATAAGTALTGSSTETVLSSYQLPANFLAAGKAIRWSGSVRATATNSTDTLNVIARVGTVALTGTSVGASGAVDVANNDVVVWDLWLTPRSAAGSTSGSIVVHGFVSAPGAEGTATTRVAFEVLSSVDFTAAQYVAVTGTWSTTSGSNSCQCESFNVVELA